MGSTEISATTCSAYGGSPPYTWGALGGALKMAWEAGITPIYMGSTVVPDEVGSEAEDHPHIHGEHKRLVKRQLWRLGSPPYTWGARKRSL